MSNGSLNGVISTKSYARISDVHPLPTLIEVQLESFEWFRKEGLRELFDEISPITSFNKNLELYFLDYRFDEPKYSESECRIRDMTYAAPIWVNVRLLNKDTGEVQEQEVFMGDFPLMTKNGTFVVNGAERVVVSQLIRSPGVYFQGDEDRATGRFLATAKLIPSRGAWLEFETSKRDVVSVKVDRKRKIPATVLLRAIGFGTDEELLAAFAEVDTAPDHPYIQSTIERDPVKGMDDALLEFYRKLRPGDPPTLENAKTFMQQLLFSPRRYDLGKVGRYKLNKRLGLSTSLELRVLTKEDLHKVIATMIRVNNGIEHPDDIDHLGNRRLKTVGELIQNQLRIGLLRMERVVRERMSIRDPEQVAPALLVNIRPVVAAIREFFGGSQLSQFMQQTNPLDELTHKRRLSALGPGGLRRERAGFDVRDVHHSHYGRICPIETPEGPNIGLIGSLATYAEVNEFGFIETPYRRILKSVKNDGKALIGYRLFEKVSDDAQGGYTLADAGTEIDANLAKRLARLALDEIKIVPVVSKEVEHLSADEEEHYIIAQANAPLTERGEFVESRISCRRGAEFVEETPDKIDFMDVSPKQIVSVSAALIPFLEHDDANRALMGSNMQRQAVPLLKPEAPIVGTGMERVAATDSGQVIIAEEAGEVISVTGRTIKVKSGKTVHSYDLRRFSRSNQSTCIDQRPIVSKGQMVQKGQPLADSSSTQNGELALGQNILVAFLSWEGGNFEDAMLVSEEVVRADKFSSIHIEKHEIEARDTKLGPEEITRDIPNVGEDALKDLDEEGIIRIGADVGPGDILVGKITPKGETELTPEEKLLRAIFGEKAREVKDSSLRLPHGEKGKVVDIKIFTRDEHPDMAAGVDKLVRISIAQRRKVTEGDKMAGRHGNKGVISRIVPIEDMPYLEDGTPIQIILNPLGVPGRMNIGQILEAHLGWAADRIGFRAISPVFDGAREVQIEGELARAWLMERAWKECMERAWEWLRDEERDTESLADDHAVRMEYLKHLRKEDRSLSLASYHESRRTYLAHWLADKGFNPEEIIVTDEEIRSPEERSRLAEKATDVCLRLWCGDHGHKVSAHGDARQEAEKISREVGWPLPTSGKTVLYDGHTGQPYDHPVTVGVVQIMKLAHLVEDKVHARSTGPYSLVTQQPLGGKAQFGGQRFGEMEVWALEAYGAAHTLQEMLTVKSDDVVGRVKTYEAIVKGEPIEEPGIPESFRVLVKELQSLGLAVEVYDKEGSAMQFGKEQEEKTPPKMTLGMGYPDMPA
jgi:DNA-directed RNA polymerase subunit beta